MIDLHCDTILLLEKATGRADLRKNPFSVDIEKLQVNHSRAQFFALFIDLEKHKDSWKFYNELYSIFLQEMKKNSEKIQFIHSYEEYMNNKKISAFLSVEEGGVLEGNLHRLERLYDDGVRLLTLTWNYENSLGYPHGKRFHSNGLKKFGKEVVEWMNYNGMIIDVSHLSDGGFYDVARLSKKPFVASHSNARTLCGNSRNLTDPMLKKIGETGSLVGLNFYHKFLNNQKVSTIESMVHHIDHMVNMAGQEAVALGTDFDGIKGALEIQGIDQMYLLKNALRKRGYSEEQIDKIWYKNAERLLQEIL